MLVGEPAEGVGGLHRPEPTLPVGVTGDEPGDQHGGEDAEGRRRAEPGVTPGPLAGPLAERGLGRVLQRAVVELALEVVLELAGRLVAPGGVGGEAAGDDRRDGRRDRRVRPPGVGDGAEPVGDHGRQDVVDRAAADRERVAAGEQLVKDDAERVDVAPGVDRGLAVAEGVEVLGGHVGERPADERGRGADAELGVGGEVEVEQERLAVVGEQDVGRLQVAVEDAPLVGVGQPVGHPRDQPEHGRDVTQPAEPLGLRARGTGRDVTAAAPAAPGAGSGRGVATRRPRPRTRPPGPCGRAAS